MELSVEITAEIEKLKKGLKESEKVSKDFEKRINNSHKGISKGSEKATNSIKGFNTSVGNGSSALTSFSRIVQDAPFGFTAIANNITNTAEQFGHLTRKTGSAGGAIRSMLSSLKGIGGVTFGISVATSLIVAFGDKLFTATKRTKEFTEAIGKSSTDSIVKFKLLTDTILDVNASQKDQAQAVRVLKKEFSDFDTSLLTNRTNYQSAKLAVEQYTNSLVQQARSQAALGLIQEKQAKILELEEKKLLRIRNEYGSITIEQFENRRQKLIEVAQKQAGDLSLLGEKERSIREKQLSRMIDNINSRFDAIKDMGAKEISELESQIQRLSVLGNVRNKVLFGNNTNSENQRPVVEGIKTQMKGISDAWIAEAAATSQNLEKYNPFPEVDLQPIQNSLSNYELLMLEFNERIKEGVGQSIVNTFQLLGNNIGQALSNGGNIFKAVGNTILQGMGQFLSRMGDLLIKYGLLAKMKGKLDLAIAKGGPFAIGAGVAAVALGVALKAIGSAFSNASQGGFSGGNVGSGTGNFNSGSSIGSSIFSSNNLANQNLTFTIQGTDLVAVLNNTTNQNGIFGGNVFVSN